MNKIGTGGLAGVLSLTLAAMLLAACENKPKPKPKPSNPNVTSSVNPPTPATPTIAPTR